MLSSLSFWRHRGHWSDMASTTGAAFCLSLVIASCILSGVSAAIDGRPRPKNFPDQPTETYDNTPQLTDASTGAPVNCIWYGFANENYDAATTSSCLLVLRKALLNETVNPPSKMEPYVYYTLKRLTDPATNQVYCYQGCFNLGASALAPTPGVDASAPAPLAAGPPPLDFGVPPSNTFSPAPSVDFPGAPPPLTFGVPPSNTFSPAPSANLPGAPPPLTFGVPPSNTFSPAPSVFPGAPPPMDTSPLGAAVPPASITAPPGSSPAPGVGVPVPSPPSPLGVSPLVSPPAPPTGPVLVPNDGSYSQPVALFSFLVIVVALLFNLAA